MRSAHAHLVKALLVGVAVLVAVSPAFARPAAAPPKGAAVMALGKKLFQTNCGGCHTLSAAGTHGHIGPNLGLQMLEYGTVTWMIQSGDSVMPGFKGRLTTVQTNDIAAFVIQAIS